MPDAGVKAGGTLAGAAGISAVPGRTGVPVSPETGCSWVNAAGAVSAAGVGWDVDVSAGGGVWGAGEACPARDGVLGGLG